MAIKTMLYDTKITSATTTYCVLSPADHSELLLKLIEIQAFMGEMSLTKVRIQKDWCKWYTTSIKAYPFNSYLKKHNSPQSMVAGLLNNILFGGQNEFTEAQFHVLEGIIGVYAGTRDELERVYNLKLQKNSSNDSYRFIENLFTS